MKTLFNGNHIGITLEKHQVGLGIDVQYFDEFECAVDDSGFLITISLLWLHIWISI